QPETSAPQALSSPELQTPPGPEPERPNDPEDHPPQASGPINATPTDTPIQRTLRMVWTPKEEDLFRTAADLAWEEGMTRKDLASRLKINLPHRSLDAIMKRLPPAGPSSTTLPTQLNFIYRALFTIFIVTKQLYMRHIEYKYEF
ncbi:MAG: hypothetical protein ACRCT2_09385, partial [Plesiomonas shigelloides]